MADGPVRASSVYEYVVLMTARDGGTAYGRFDIWISGVSHDALKRENP